MVKYNNDMINDLPTANQLLDYFIDKVVNIRTATAASTEPVTTLPQAQLTLDHFEVCDTEAIRTMIMSTSSASCDSDPIPTFILKDCLTELLPYIIMMCSAA